MDDRDFGAGRLAVQVITQTELQQQLIGPLRAKPKAGRRSGRPLVVDSVVQKAQGSLIGQLVNGLRFDHQWPWETGV